MECISSNIKECAVTLRGAWECPLKETEMIEDASVLLLIPGKSNDNMVQKGCSCDTMDCEMRLVGKRRRPERDVDVREQLKLRTI
ncbi:unnamed protein product [Hydatigera taeniaeformis]|uniref:Uncharacterized protein n=1 Tax=Hydatigena taeniaeformis TaxID=6205 RepID=A0A0R3X8S1_HYDTA|nr:unnamed protein product [Hydatigera taeniaeformis]